MADDLERARQRCLDVLEATREVLGLLEGKLSSTRWENIIGDPTANQDLVDLVDSIFENGIPDFFPKPLVITTIQPGDGQLLVHFDNSEPQPIPINTVEYSLDGGEWIDSEQRITPLLITGLPNDVEVGVRLRAVNQFETSDPSNTFSATPEEVPATIPNAPVITDVSPGDQQVSISFLLGSDGGDPITDVQYQLDLGSWVSFGATTSPQTISGLTNGQQVQVNIRARNSIGASPRSNPLTETPFTTPVAPVIDSIIAGNEQLQVEGTLGFDGGRPISDIEYRLDGGSWTSSGLTNFPFIISGLTNGQSYDVEVRSVNQAGESPISNLVAGTPVAVPDAPFINSLTNGDQQLTVNFTLGADNGSPITDVEYRVDGGTWVSFGATTSPQNITGLTNGQLYAVEIRSVNSVGASLPSSQETAIPSTVPDAPTITTIDEGDQELIVHFTTGIDGGSPITDIEYRLDSGSAVSAGTTSSPFSITGLTNEQSYDVEIRAVNANGASGWSNLVAATPTTGVSVPDAPTADSLTEGDQFLDVHFTLNGNGGSVITDVEYQLDGGAWISAGQTTSPIHITGLTNGQAYLVRVRAINAQGSSPQSNDLNGTPGALPEVTILSVKTTGGSAEVSFNATEPPILNVEYRLDGGSWINLQTTISPGNIPNLTPSVTYSLELRAENSRGFGDPSDPFVFTVGVPQSGLIRWYEASSLDEQANNSPVSSWDDFSQEGVDGTQTGSSRPELRKNILNGESVVHFDGFNDSLNLGTAGLNSLSDEISFFIMSRTIGQQESVLIATTPDNHENRFLIHLPIFFDDENLLAFDFGDRDGSGRLLEPWDSQFNKFYLWEFNVTGSRMRVRRNGQLIHDEAHSDSVNFTTEILRLGFSFGDFFGGDVAAMLMYNRNLDAGERSDVFDYLRNKYSYPRVPDAPVITSITPQDESLVVHYNVPNDGGLEVTKVEYQVDGGSWTEQTNDPITITGLTNDQEYDISVRVSNNLGTSDPSAVVSGTPVQASGADAEGGDWVYEINDGGTFYRVHEFTEGSKEFEVLTAGDFEYVIVGGGGGGATNDGEGGSGGQVITGTTSLSTGTYPINIGSFGDAGREGGGGNPGESSSAFGFSAGGGSAGVENSGNGSDGANGVLRTITGDSIRYGAGGGSAGGSGGNEYGTGGETDGGDAADDNRRGWSSIPFGYKGKSGMGAGGGGTNNTGARAGAGGYGTVIVRYEIGVLTSPIQYPLKPRPQPPSVKWYASWNSANYWVGNTIKHQGNVTNAESMRNSSGNPWSGAPVIAVIPSGLDEDGDEASWAVQLNEQKTALQNIGSDNVHFVFLGDEPGDDILLQERMIETARSVLNDGGHDFKFCFTYTYFNSFDGIDRHNDQVPGNLDYAQPNYYPYRADRPLTNNLNQASFNENYEDLVGRMWDKVGPNTRLALTGQFFYDWNNVGDWKKPPDDMPFWLAEKVINDSRVDGITWWRYLDQPGGPGKGGEHSSMATFRNNVEAAYQQYFANQ